MNALKIVALLLFAGLVACEGDQGPVGPAGNANVRSGSLSPTNAEWLWYSEYWLQVSSTEAQAWFTRYVDVTVPEITADIIANGAVLVYMEPLPGSGNWVPLNYTFTALANVYYLHFAYETSAGLLRLHFFMTAKNTAPPSTQTHELPVYTFRYVVIAGTALQLAQQDGVDLRNYESVKVFAESVGSLELGHRWRPSLETKRRCRRPHGDASRPSIGSEDGC